MTTSTGYSLEDLHSALYREDPSIAIEWLNEDTDEEQMVCSRRGQVVNVGVIDGRFEIDSSDAHWSTPDRFEAVGNILRALGCEQ